MHKNGPEMHSTVEEQNRMIYLLFKFKYFLTRIVKPHLESASLPIMLWLSLCNLKLVFL